MARTNGDDVYVATESFNCEIDGVPQAFKRGVTRVRAGHEVLKRNPQYFEPVDNSVHFDVEQMTAAPGEKRGAA